MTPTERRRTYKQNIIDVMGGACVCCGYNRCNRALQLHHLNPEDKNFGISDKTYFAWNKLEAELKKCILVCSNCHMEIEDNLLEVEQVSSFNQEKFNQYANAIEAKKIGNICIDCGAQIDHKATRCVECSNKNRQVVERPNRLELKTLIRTVPFTKIGAMYNVSDTAIRKWCKAYNLPSKSSVIKAYTDEEWALI